MSSSSRYHLNRAPAFHDSAGIKRVWPSVLVKGADIKREEVGGGDMVEAARGSAVLVDPVPGQSSAAIIKRAVSKEPSKRGGD